MWRHHNKNCLFTMNINEVLMQFDDKFIELLDQHCNLFKVIGCEANGESPRWLQYRGDKNHMDEHDLPTNLYFQNSANSQIWIGLDISHLSPEQRMCIDFHYQEVYDHFKALKYKHLRTKHPTISC